MLPEISSAADRIFCHFGPLFAFLTPPPPPPNNLKNPNFEKLKKATGGIIILHKRTKNYGQMMYGSSDMVLDGCNYFSFWTIFYPFTPPNNPKNQN